MGVNKVEYAGRTLVDLTADTVTPETLKKGIKAHNRAGEQIVGVMPEYMPVGYIYLSASDTSPASLFGGTWEKIEGKFLLASSKAHTLGTTGGEEKHKLSVAELPEHQHGIVFALSASAVRQDNGYARSPLVNDMSRLSSTTGACDVAGEDQPHNNMPPYLTVHMWKRVA